MTVTTQRFCSLLSLASLILLSQAMFVVGANAQTRPLKGGAEGFAQEQQVRPAGSIRNWRDVDGNALPFASDDELLDYLRTADVVAEKNLSTGITHPIKLTLSKNGVSAHAVFRYVNEEKPSADFGHGDVERHFRDSYLFEPAAYELSRLIGLESVPPATVRSIRGREGSVQIWVEKSQTETMRTKNKLLPPDESNWSKQAHNMRVFDALIYNTDRTQDNILIASDWKVWLIDHTRAFRTRTTLLNEQAITNCERRIYEQLKTIDSAAARERLKPYLRQSEITAVLKRRDVIVKRLDKLIAKRGGNAVLFTLQQ